MIPRHHLPALVCLERFPPKFLRRKTHRSINTDVLQQKSEQVQTIFVCPKHLAVPHLVFFRSESPTSRELLGAPLAAFTSDVPLHDFRSYLGRTEELTLMGVLHPRS